MGRTDQVSPLGSADSVRHMTEWDKGAHGVGDTAPARLLLRAGMRADYPPPTTYDEDSDLYSGVAVQTSTEPMDNEPEDHGLDETGRSESNPHVPGLPSDVVTPVPLHYRDLGVPAVKHRDIPRTVQSDQKDETERRTVAPGAVGSQAELVVGAYGYPAMNPVSNEAKHTPSDGKGGANVSWAGSTHDGYRVYRWLNRRFPMHRWAHDARPLWLHTARTAGNSPAGTNLNVSPYAALANTRVGNYLTPMMRRQPIPWDEAAVNDGSQVYPEGESLNSWGL